MSSTVLCYRDAAVDWERQGLPIGNGRLGAMVLAAPGRVRVVFNVDSLWTGNENPSGEFDDDGFGAYQAFGEFELELDESTATSAFLRRLDLAQALHEATWVGAEDNRIETACFASNPAQVIALRLNGSCPVSGRVSLEGAHDERVAAGPQRLSFEGVLPNGLRYAAVLWVVAEGGEASAVGERVHFGPTRAVTLYLGAATNYAMDRSVGWRDASALGSVEPALERAARLGFDALEREHVRDHQSLFDRVHLDLGSTDEALRQTPDNLRITEYEPGSDPELLVKLFQYGRYLLIASSRENCLPANLQGLWNQSNDPPWHSDYHTNINVQMNYWLAEPAHLSECHVPLFDLLDATLGVCREATQAAFGSDVPGFCYRTSLNIHGGQGWEWNATANAWCAMHYWDHYAFGCDEDFLRERAWPFFEGASRFWLARLKRLDDGRLVVPDGWSPEHGPREDGVTYDQHLVWELFSITERAARVLGIEDDLVGQVREARSRLVEPRVGHWGQLMEWMQDRDDPDDRHRHTSHLIGVYPGTRISPDTTPEFAKAAQVALAARGETGDSRRSWTWPWRCALWARLGSVRGHRMLDGLVEHNLLPNSVTTHPPLQLDGNFGITAAICEMLVQSHTGEIHCLPGVDRSLWPEGSFSGLCARGGFDVGARWRPGSITVELRSKRGGPVVVKTPYANVAAARADHGATLAANMTESGGIRLETQAGSRYRLEFQ